MKILIVDDQKTNLFLLNEYLCEKHEIFEAENGFKALKIIADQKPELVLLDVMMPGMDGFEVLERIKTNPDIQHISVIMITARSGKEDVKKALILGADDYIKKPIDTTELFTKLDIQSRIISKRKELEQYQVYANIHESMILAQRIQQALLPDRNEFHRIFPNSFIIYLPKDIVSGDFYFISEQKGKKFIAIFDCTGHGVPAAMLSLLAYMALNRLVVFNGITSPLTLAQELVKELIVHLSGSTDTYTMNNGMEAAFCEYDYHTKTLCFVGAHRPLAIVRKVGKPLVINKQEIEPAAGNETHHIYHIQGDVHSLNFEAEGMPFTAYHIQIKDDDCLYLFTDGFHDQIGGPEDYKMTRKNFYQMLLETQQNQIESQKHILYNNISEWSIDRPQTDDIAVIGIKF